MYMIRRLRLGAAALVSVVATLALASPQSASATVQLEEAIIVNGGGGRADVTYDWGKYHLMGVRYLVKDTVCNGKPVYARLLLLTNGVWKPAAARWQRDGCSAGYEEYNIPSIGFSTPITAVRLRVCEEGGDVCATSAIHDNPLT